MYASGVFNETGCDPNADIDHVILVVGFGNDSLTGEPYWLIKNSWGKSWGEVFFDRICFNSNLLIFLT